ncbi:MAG TPA: 3-oxoacyl-[acyl-carrier-protein] synthase III C-terminal domain-containing protein [Gemmatimonadaceae bacterium]|nr:3-oxoacyl-[acyl-carrier-protein] synthase III C-terminal domain-containing protein [Gemmatimonadaceae bacterium]
MAKRQPLTASARLAAQPRPHHAGIEAMAEYLPSRVATLAELHSAGLLSGSAETLASFGFGSVHLAEEESNLDMAVAAVDTLFAENDIDRDEIGLILYATALSSSSTMWNAETTGHGSSRKPVLELTEVADLFRYPASQLQSELDLPNASVIGINQLGCSSMFAALRIARAMILAEDDLRSVLCVSADKFPPSRQRDLIYNVVSDGACAALVRRGAERNRIVECTHVTKGALWDSGSLENEILAAYFPTARSLIETTLEKAGLTIDDIALVVPHNVSLRSWEILGRLIGCPAERVYTENISRVGHTVASDTLLNLRLAQESGRVKPGDLLLLFTFGYGLNWACMVVEH